MKNMEERKDEVEVEWALDPDDRWVYDHFPDLATKYAGKYIAVAHQELVAVGEDPYEVDRQLREKYPDAVPYVIYIPRGEEIQCLL